MFPQKSSRGLGNLGASQMAQNTVHFRERQAGGEGDPFMGCNLALNLTKSYVGHGANLAFIA